MQELVLEKDIGKIKNTNFLKNYTNRNDLYEIKIETLLLLFGIHARGYKGILNLYNVFFHNNYSAYFSKFPYNNPTSCKK